MAPETAAPSPTARPGARVEPADAASARGGTLPRAAAGSESGGARERDGRTLEVVVIGAEGVGKTSFLGGLALMGDADRTGGLIVRGDDPASQSFLHDLRSALRRGEFPPATTATRSIAATVVHRGAILRLRLIDFAGERFRAGANAGDRESIPLLAERLRDADAILLMVDPVVDLGLGADVGEAVGGEARIAGAHPRRDERSATLRALESTSIGAHDSAARDAADRLALGARENALQDRASALVLALMDAIDQARRQAATARRREPDVAIVVTKADLVPELVRRTAARPADGSARSASKGQCSSGAGAAPSGRAEASVTTIDQGAAFRLLAERRAPFIERIRRWARAPRVFALSAVGAVEPIRDESGRLLMRPKRDPQPCGYEALLDWLVASRRAIDRAPMVRRASWFAALAALCLVIAGSAVVALRLERERALRDPLSGIEVLARMPAEGLAAPGREARLARLDAELDALARTLERGPTLTVLRESVVPALSLLLGMRPSLDADPEARQRSERITALDAEARRQMHDAWSAELLAPDPNPSEASIRAHLAAVARFREAFPGSDRFAALQAKHAAMARLVDADLRRRVAEVRWDPARPDRMGEFLLKRSAALEAYADHPLALLQPEDRAERRRAAAAARRLAETRDWQVTVLSAGPFPEPRQLYVQIDRFEAAPEGASRAAEGAVRPKRLWSWESRASATRHRPGARDRAERVLQLRPGDRVAINVGIGVRGPWFDGWWGGSGYAQIPAATPEVHPLSLRHLSGSHRLVAFPHDRRWATSFGEATIEIELRPLGGEPFTGETWSLLDRHILGDGR
ncbi:MAG TPA: hypothetical protein PKC43_12345 [Phycisphaerales bacterium]|nr:hypothetical protein [Phycisphaerales bacterium]HMP38223.1 hypothetical protein [Phycisphaerales bacterium]